MPLGQSPVFIIGTPGDYGHYVFTPRVLGNGNHVVDMCLALPTGQVLGKNGGLEGQHMVTTLNAEAGGLYRHGVVDLPGLPVENGLLKIAPV